MQHYTTLRFVLLALVAACASEDTAAPTKAQSPARAVGESATGAKPRALTEEDAATPTDASDGAAPQAEEALPPADDAAAPAAECPRFIAFPEPEAAGPAQPPSSQQSCLCYPSVAACNDPNNPAGPPLKADPELACSEDEVCDGDIDIGYKQGAAFGACRKRCNHPQSDVPSALGCAPGEYCKLVDVVLGDNESRSIGMCVPDSLRPRGGWDWTGCGESEK